MNNRATPPFWNDRVEADSVRDFILKYYKRDRLQGRDEHFPGYSEAVIKTYEDDVARDGWTFLGRHESVTGRVVSYYPQETQ